MDYSDHMLSNGQVIRLTTTTGMVLSTSRDHKLSIRQGQTTVLATGSVVSGEMSSSTHTTQELWITTDDGKERAVVLNGFTVPVREGQVVTLVAAAPVGMDEAIVFGLRNHSSDTVKAALSPLRAAHSSWNLDVGLMVNAVWWMSSPGVVVGMFAFFKTDSGSDRLPYTVVATLVGAAIGFLAWFSQGRFWAPVARAETLLKEVKELGEARLKAQSVS